MKKVILISLMFLTFLGFSQTPYSMFSSTNRKGEVGTQQGSAKNVWLGSKLSLDLNEDNPVSDNFLLTGRILYTPILGDKYGIPIMVTASPSGGDVLNPESGMNLGIYPYYLLSSNSGFTLLAHGGVGYKSLQQETEALQQIRALLGLEVALTGKTGGPPVTFSLTPVYTNTSGVIGNKSFLEATFVLPIGKNLGVLADWQSGSNQTFRVGVIVNAGLE